MEKVNLSQEDWDLLIPDSLYVLGTKKLTLRPVDITTVKRLTVIASAAAPLLAERGITAANYPEKFKEPGNAKLLAEILIEEVPDLISDGSGLELGDIKKLPFDITLGIAVRLIDLNLRMEDGLRKNFNALTGLISAAVQRKSGQSAR